MECSVDIILHLKCINLLNIMIYLNGQFVQSGQY